MARRAARMGAAALPGIADVIEASRELDPAVVEAWLLQRMPRFAVDARELRRLAGARVPGSVIDLVVALSRPEMFNDRLATRGYTLVRVDAARTQVVAMATQTPADEYTSPPATGSVGVYEGYSSSRRDRCSRCTEREIIYYESNSYPSYGYGYYPYWPYGLYPLYPVYPSYPYDPYYPSYPNPRPPQQTPPRRPPVIVHEPGPRPPGQQPTTPAPEPVNGRAIKGTGYTRSGGGGTAEPPPQHVAPIDARPRQVTPPEPLPRGATESRPTREYTPPPPPPTREYTPPPPPPTREYTPPPPPPRTATPRTEPEARPRPAPPPEPQAAKPDPTPPPPPPASTTKPEPPPRTAKPRPPS